jgi:hypothetical protein
MIKLLPSDTKLNTPALWLAALSLSIGWGIRGNYGHEYGAMIPGALAAMAIVLLAGREDWHRRIAYFAMFGAIGWSFGGSMSYGQVIGYTHSGHSLSVIYGFASLYVIGFLWAAIGGAGTALPAALDRERLTEFFPPLIAVFIAWAAQDVFESTFYAVNPQYRQESPLYWYDTDWLGALTTIAAIAVLAIVRRRFDRASSLILHMAVGWWVGFVLFVLILGWRMTPPRGDNWAGCLGMTAGMLIYFQRQGLSSVVWASLVTAFIGGFGFAGATMYKLIWMKTGWNTNWHSVMEQTYGFINGLGVAAAMIFLAARERRLEDCDDERSWHDLFAIVFTLLIVTWVNLRKNPETWVKAKAVPEAMLGLSSHLWFDLAYALLAAAVIWLLVAHRRRALPIVPASWLGKGQLLYLIFLWWMVAGNFERAVVAFVPQRMVTEGVIFLNAAICTLTLLLCSFAPVREPAVERRPAADFGPLIMKAAVVGLIGMALSVGAQWGIVRMVYGDMYAGSPKTQIRFGPNATATNEKPKPAQPHP